jgi:hypothetical protein
VGVFSLVGDFGKLGNVEWLDRPVQLPGDVDVSLGRQVALVDGLPGSGDDLSSLGRRAHGYLVKPVKPERLLEAIREIIARYRGALDTGSGA